MNSFAPALRLPTFKSGSIWAFFGALAMTLLIAGLATAATNNGTPLQAAYNTLNDMVNGYGKQLLTVMGFGVAGIGYMATNATGIVMKFVGFAIFLGVGLAAAVALVGAVI